MKKLIMLIVIGVAVFANLPAYADHNYGFNNRYVNHYGGYYNHHGWNNRGYYNRWHVPPRYNRPYYGNRGWHRRDRDIAGIIVGGIILGEILRNNNNRHYHQPYRQSCYDARRFGYDSYGNRVEYFERICN